MITIEITGGELFDLMTEDCTAQIVMTSMFLLAVQDEAKKSQSLDSLKDLCTKAASGEGFTFEKPLKMCFWSASEGKANFMKVKRIKTYSLVTDELQGTLLPVVQLFYTDLYPVHTRELLQEITDTATATFKPSVF